ncbi:hypothetical protein OHB41_48645 [Streptomyces sp. NBC_01571]|uniref:hypothetical protein n=1 Tax=Streptomyces sp. NBC_01571 TaxID=2975883 RepID=UPI00225588E9|nr:hypothetical protein [Streptomyces sp. NBC_01571]MCX4580844.1 hypothetical protein [Streptomyces sp. NBC_01571]
MTLTITDVRTGLSLPGSAVDETGSGRHRGLRADEDGWVPEGDHGRHRRLSRTGCVLLADAPHGPGHDANRPAARGESANLGWEQRVADDLAALEALIAREKTLRDRAQDL